MTQLFIDLLVVTATSASQETLSEWWSGLCGVRINWNHLGAKVNFSFKE